MHTKNNYIDDRIYVSNLINSLLVGKMRVLDVLKLFPKRKNDPSLNAAFHAIVHYEADEDLRKRDSLYAQQQDECLYEMALILAKGESLPVNIICEYNDFHDETLIFPEMNKKTIFERLKKMINF